MNEEKKKPVFTRLIKYAIPYWGQLALALFLVLAIVALDLYRPIILGTVVDLFAESGDFSSVVSYAIRYLIVIVAIFGCNFAQTWIRMII